MTYTNRLREHPRRALVVTGFAVVVFVASVLPGATESLASTGPLGVVGLDKWFHTVGYTGLGFGGAYALGARRARDIGVAVVAVGIYGAGIELVQAGIPSRAFSFADMGANVFGAILGGLCWYAATRLQNGR